MGGARARLVRRFALEMRADLDEVHGQADETVQRTRESRERGVRGPHSSARRPPRPPADDVPPPGPRAAAAELVDVHDHDDVVERVVGCALWAVPAARWSALSVLDPGGSATLRRVSDQRIAPLEDRQVGLGVGPVPDALVTGAAVVTDDVVVDPRWPQLASLAAQVGVHGVAAVPMAGRRVRATLTFYADAPGAFDPADLSAAEAFTDHAAIALSGARRVAGMNRALASRDIIGQAKGILAQRDGLDPHAAFAKLVTASQHANLKVVDVARWMVGEEADGMRPAES